MYTPMLFVGGPFHGTWAAVRDHAYRWMRPVLPELTVVMRDDPGIEGAVKAAEYSRLRLRGDVEVMMYEGMS
jgi:hypothetical protein